MADKISQEQRSANMAAVRNKNTKPEVLVRKKVFTAGFRYRLHVRNLPGTPDMVLPRYRIAVFVNGCFWHGHDCPKGKLPASNRDFWVEKISRNIDRDRRSNIALEEDGWTVVTIWACQLDEGISRLLEQLRTKREDC